MMKGRFAIFLTVAVVLVLLVALNAASYVQVERPGDWEFDPDRSTLNAGATGTRAFYEYLQQAGHNVARWNLPPSALHDENRERPATFVVVGRVRQPFEKEEPTPLLRWVMKGGRLVIIDREPDARLLPAAGRWRVTSEVVEYPGPRVVAADADAMTRDTPPVRPAQPTALTRDVEEVSRSRFAGRLLVSENRDTSDIAGGGYGPPPPPAPASEATPPTPAAGEDDNVEPMPAPVVHVPDGRGDGGALLVDYEYGSGRIIVLGDPYVVANGGVARGDNLLLAANVVAGGGGLIVFDEYHQGYGASRQELFAYFAGTPVLWFFAQGAFVVLALVWTRGRRFARPLPAPHVDRRSKLEFVASMAELQQRARAYDLAIENIYARTRRALARYAGLPATAPTAEVAARVAARSGKDAGRLAALLRECEDAASGTPVKGRRAVELVAQLRELERDLGILMRAREIRQSR